MNTNELRERYPYIVVWGRYVDHSPAMTDATLLRAAEEDAPDDAVYQGQDGRWRTADEICHPNTRRALGLPALPADAL